MKYVLIIIGLLLLASSASATDDWWDMSYQYRVPITLTGNTSGSQINYQLLLNVSYTSNMQSDFDDLRFTDDSSNLQSAWLESKMDGSWANIWVNFTTTPDNGLTQTYYMYYGNTEVSNYWNGTNTFEFFDDFNNLNAWTQQSETWTTNNSILQAPTTNNAYLRTNNPITLNSYIVRSRYEHLDGKDRYDVIVNSNNPLDASHSLTGKTYQASNKISISPDWSDTSITTTINSLTWYKFEVIKNDGANRVALYSDNNTQLATISTTTNGTGTGGYLGFESDIADQREIDWILCFKYVVSPPINTFGIEEKYALSAASETPTPTLAPTPTPLKEITSSNYVIQNQTLYITKPCDLQYKITSNSFVYGGLRNINTVICDNNNTVISGWFKISTNKKYNADYTFIINVNDTSYQSKIVTLKQQQVDSSIISKIYKRTLLIDGYEIYSYNTTVYIVSILPNPIYFYFNLEDRIIQFGDKQFNNQTLVFNQLNFDDQYNFMDNASSDTVVMKFKTINPTVKSGAELKGLTGILLNALSKIPFIGKSFKNVLYYPLFFIQIIFNFAFTFLDIIVNDWWYALMLLEIVCIFSASRQAGYANIMEVYINTHVKIIQFIYEIIILNMINLIIKIVVTIKDMIKWW